jgi:H/ACA ribonucleoprotein complex subunit 4
MNHSDINGFLIIDKPQGPTSHDICEIVKRIINASKTSHSGTLDPQVTGVLVMGIGKAARLLRFLPSDKTYIGTMRLHEDVGLEKLKETIKKDFTGKIMQMPPVKSRVKRQEREREVYSFDIIEKDKQNVLFKVHCQAGTYIRKLVHDLGEKLGIEAHMTELRRTQSGAFTEADSITLYQLQEIMDKGKLNDYIKPLEIVSDYLSKIEIKNEVIEQVRHGSPIFKDYLDEKELKKAEKLKKESFAAIISTKKLIEIAKIVLEENRVAVPETVL